MLRYYLLVLQGVFNYDQPQITCHCEELVPVEKQALKVFSKVTLGRTDK